MTDPEKSAARLRRQLADRLSEAGHLKSPQWQAAVEAVPRHKFLSGGFFRSVPGSSPTAYAPVLPDEYSEGWLSLCYADESLVTQIAGTVVPRDITGTIARQPSSSSTLPSLMVDMLEALDVEDGNAVLEIGTGTGYNAGLLAHRIGVENITTVETDPDVAASARHALWGCGYQVDVVVADGRKGYADSAPYDRVIATCGVTRVRQEWVNQTRPGGIILTTLRGGLWSSGLAKLTRTGDGTAEGAFISEASFMRARQEKPESNLDIPGPDDGERRRTHLGGDIAHDWTARFIIDNTMDGLSLIGGVSLAGEPPSDYFLHPESGSFAAVSGSGDEGYTVRQGGPLRMWDTAERAIGEWREQGSPGVTAFRIRVTPEAQTVYLESAPGVAWVKPAGTASSL
ncbi:ATP-grasp peptide maturase system methyltransferase [Streptomyces litchfieldiae]|uniref:Protein-L-isoaspartate O-methyltransferase n=1 Tax=Streptomyces litchfieldiae TaxID=3075543 RepID=A0ABU2MT35_9ACTN|nr:ATP-grasp peptide maturase system methyltransferase [Streptomyces sp. DSM 44938]MDT0344796.1 ATP-grasp peptide maturase system methyltransferase [Streptomyces sp. DSM 44938]